MIIKDLLKYGVDGVGDKPTVLLDVEILLAHALQVDREFLFKNPNEEVDGDIVMLFSRYIDRLKDGEPVAYITNYKEFYGLSFFVDNRVLIPRPETEEICNKALNFLDEISVDSPKVLDVGTGSGNIAISIAASFNSDVDLLVDAVDISYDAIEVAGLNVLANSVEDRVHVFQSDLLDSLDDDEHYDVIVANLPYIGEYTNRFVSPETEKYEPNIALFGGKNGLELYDKMFDQLGEKAIDFDLMIGEFGFGQRKEMGDLLQAYFPGRWIIENDLAGIERLFIITK